MNCYKIAKRKIIPLAILLFCAAGWCSVCAQEIPFQLPSSELNDKISLDLRGVEIGELLKILSRRSNLNIIPSGQVKGRVSIFLNDVSVDDAIEIILISQDLAAEKKDGIVYVMTAAEYQQIFGKKYYEKRKIGMFKLNAADPQAVFNVFSQVKSDIGKVIVDAASGTIIAIDVPESLEDMEKALAHLEQLPQQELFKLNYAEADDIKSELSSVLTPGISKIQIDKRTNQMFISDLPEKMELIKGLVEAFDEPTKQVFIEAEIVQVVLSDKFEKGIAWDRAFTKSSLNGLGFGGKFYGQFPLQSSTSFSSTKQGYVSIGSLATDGYSAIMQFLETKGRTNILSRPRIAVLNNEEAKILIGTREAYTTGTLSQAESTTVTSENIEFVDVGIKLNVVPRIGHDDYITMKIKPEVSVVKEYIETKVLQSRVPIIETSEVETVVKIKNGSMIMIGGLIKKEKSDSSSGLPFFSKVPFLDFFFHNKIKECKKTELIIFLRPRIITGENVGLAGIQPSKEEITFKRFPKDFLQ